ncbi:MAG: glycoside hydrolase family 92 protein [Bacteroidetes bacterium]|nr:glycoside hydrolase family 92 protein [Bacteroidota bacterium]
MKKMRVNGRFIFSGILATLVIALSYSAIAGPDNVAKLAKVSASAELNVSYTAVNVIDGLIRTYGIGEWASNSKENPWGGINYPWIQLNWEKVQVIDKIIFYDRASLESHLAGGTLQFSDGSELSVNLIPNDGSACVVEFPAKEVEWFRFEVRDGIGDNMGLSEIEVFPSTEGELDPVSMVDPYIETTRGRYFFFVTGSRPFGMISSAPLTRNKNQMGGGYNYNSTEILSFPQIHAWMLSGLELMPTTGEVDPSRWHDGWKSEFSHKSEIVQPGYHRVFLDKYHTWVEQTASDRVSFYRFRYTEDAEANILVNLGGYVSTSTMTGAQVNKKSDTEIEGSFNTVGRIWGGPEKIRIFFALKLEKPMERFDSWKGEIKKTDVSSLEAEDVSSPRREKGMSYHDAPTAGVSAYYHVKRGDELKVKIAISYTSIENAWENMESDFNHWDFEKIREEARDDWNQSLGKIDVKGGTRDQRVKFYTDLWHTLLGRHKLNDYSGDYPDYTQGEKKGAHTDASLQVRKLPSGADGNPKFNMYNSDAFWLTQWNLNILWGLGWPHLLDDFSASLVQYADNGKLLPRGPCAGGYSYIMTGCPATNLIVSAYMKGLLRKVDDKHAFEIMKQNHQPGGMMGGDEIDFYVKKGWRPNNAGITLEWAFQDWALSQMAIKMGEKKDAQYYLKRSNGWKNLYKQEEGLIFPKDKNGNWVHNNPLSGRGWIEANAWQGTWSVSHDIAGLAELMGGNERLCDKLNYAFEKGEPNHFVFAYNDGYVSYANQPGCSNAHVFNYAGKPWLSQYWVRKVNEQAYGGTTPDKGYGGHDEDQGQMGGVSALMSMGLFSLKGTTSVDPVYEITSPVFDEIIIKLDQKYYPGESFTIKTHNNSDENCYIQKAELNGMQLDQCWFTHEEFSKGGLLELWMGDKPNKNWGTKK